MKFCILKYIFKNWGLLRPLDYGLSPFWLPLVQSCIRHICPFTQSTVSKHWSKLEALPSTTETHPLASSCFSYCWTLDSWRSPVASILTSGAILSVYSCSIRRVLNKRNVGHRYCLAGMYAGRVACCPLVTHVAYVDGTDSQRTDG